MHGVKTLLQKNNATIATSFFLFWKEMLPQKLTRQSKTPWHKAK